jgi:serine/threonine-protein kinase
VFSVQRGGLRQVFSQPADGGAAAQLVETPFAALATAVSSDGRYVAVVNDDRRGRNDILIHDRQSGATTPWLETEFDEDLAEFSPDGRWLAYTSDETGRPEVYVRPFPGPGQKYPISTQGGTGALWSRDGREIFYAEGPRMMRVEVASSPRFTAGAPEPLFTHTDLIWERPRNYDVTPDGKTFIMITRRPGSGTRSLRLVLDWVSELERLVPGGGR